MVLPEVVIGGAHIALMAPRFCACNAKFDHAGGIGWLPPANDAEPHLQTHQLPLLAQAKVGFNLVSRIFAHSFPVRPG